MKGGIIPFIPWGIIMPPICCANGIIIIIGFCCIIIGFMPQFWPIIMPFPIIMAIGFIIIGLKICC